MLLQFTNRYSFFHFYDITNEIVHEAYKTLHKVKFSNYIQNYLIGYISIL